MVALENSDIVAYLKIYNSRNLMVALEKEQKQCTLYLQQ